MSDGLRAEVAVDAASTCPLTSVSDETDAAVTDVTWTRAADGSVTEEFRVDGGADGGVDSADAEPLVDVGDDEVYRFERDPGSPCACEAVEAAGVPVSDVTVEGDTLLLSLHLPDVGALRTVVERLGDVSDHVGVRYLVRGEAPAEDDVGLRDDDLTDRQAEVVRTAYDMGYFEHPRDSNATEVASALDIEVSTFTEHLAVAQSKLLKGLARA
jgi:predicted DNA binding protein